MTLPAGDYTTNIILRAITNSPPPTMQDIDFWQGSLIPDHPVKAKDTRDGKYYNVTKLSSDNRIWMTQNLNLSGGTTLTPADSNVKENYTLPASSTTGFNEYSVAYVYNDKTYGGYYSYMAATAGTNPGTNDSTDINAPSDICPKGWRLPTKAEYDTLKSTYTTGATLTAAPWNGEYGGSYYNGTAYNVGSMGNYWTSTASYTNMAYIVSIEDAVVSIYDDSNYYGSSVRCLVRNPDTIITYNANGGTGTMANQNFGENGSGTLNTNTFTRDGYTFTGWNTKADGSGTSYANTAAYTGTSVTLYAQWKMNVTITFNANGGTGTMSSQTISYPGTNLTSNAFTRSGYVFSGWNTKADGSGNKYTDRNFYYEEIQNITLYAQWREYNNITELTYMQDFAILSSNALTNVKNSMTTNAAYILKDNRDETSYYVSKLADGKIWLLDNLALDLTNTTVKSKLTPSTTNATTTSINKLLNGGGTTSDRYATAGVSSSWAKTYSAPIIYSGSKDVVPDNAPTNGKGNNKVGDYYNFCAASAGSYCYGNGDQPGTSSGNATEDICPAGWRMPTGDATGEYAALASIIYGSTATGWIYDDTFKTNYRNALSIPLSAGFNTSPSTSLQGLKAWLWSSTRSNDNSMYRMTIETTLSIPSDNEGRRFRCASVRCIAR